MKKTYLLTAILLGVILFFYTGFVHYTEQYQLGISWNFFTGELRTDEHAGIHVTPPWVVVSRIDTRPMRVCVTTSGRGFNCKLVEFEPGAWKQFVAIEGFRYWWWSNRISFNLGYGEEYRGMRDLLRGYAYGVKKYLFIRILHDYQGGE